jgi:hypothetical protein
MRSQEKELLANIGGTDQQPNMLDWNCKEQLGLETMDLEFGSHV